MIFLKETLTLLLLLMLNGSLRDLFASPWIYISLHFIPLTLKQSYRWNKSQAYVKCV